MATEKGILCAVSDFGWIRYSEPGWQQDLSTDAHATLPGHLGFVLRLEADVWHVDIVTLKGDLLWSDYGAHSDQLHAILCAEQRYLVEQVGAGSVRGSTYLDKADERIRQWNDNA